MTENKKTEVRSRKKGDKRVFSELDEYRREYFPTRTLVERLRSEGSSPLEQLFKLELLDLDKHPTGR